MSRYFLDTEFLADDAKRRIDLISLGLVAEDGREYYAILTDDLYDIGKRANSWLQEHVLAQVQPWSDRAKADPLRRWRTRAEAHEELLSFVKAPTEFWAYYAAYDWVLFCQLLGGFPALPTGWPNWVMDLKQLATELAVPLADPPPWHHALLDARWARDTHARLRSHWARADCRFTP